MHKAHEHLMIGVFLSLLGGFLDAYTYVLKDGVFANAQTGNLVLLSLSVLSGHLSNIIKYLIPILMFALGIFLSEVLKGHKRWLENNQGIKLVILFEAILIVIIALLGPWVNHSVINSTISFLAAVQVANFNKIKGSPIATTMITGNLRSTMTGLAHYLQTKDRQYIEQVGTYLVVILTFALGAVLGGSLSHLWQDKAILVGLVFLLGAYIILLKEEK
ncbi:YoaK family protein [Spirochaeta cellobiosiphila]|uniref:YoaK family protein n=1 Tax=Spirochaeta cellobiosiphila TaxID=504483 RepID=UPI00041591FF|nr:YoaK family protein [Spirochaeta cellobiosiphila]